MLSGDENHLLVENTSKGVYKFTPLNIINDISSDNADLLKVTNNNNNIVLSPTKQSYDDTNLQEQIKGLKLSTVSLSQKIKELTDNKDTYNPIKSIELYTNTKLLHNNVYPKFIRVEQNEIFTQWMPETVIDATWFKILIHLTNEEEK